MTHNGGMPKASRCNAFSQPHRQDSDGLMSSVGEDRPRPANTSTPAFDKGVEMLTDMWNVYAPIPADVVKKNLLAVLKAMEPDYYLIDQDEYFSLTANLRS